MTNNFSKKLKPKEVSKKYNLELTKISDELSDDERLAQFFILLYKIYRRNKSKK